MVARSFERVPPDGVFDFGQGLAGCWQWPVMLFDLGDEHVGKTIQEERRERIFAKRGKRQPALEQGDRGCQCRERQPIDFTEAPDDELEPLWARRQDEPFGNGDAGRQRFLKDRLRGLSVRSDHAADEARRTLALAIEQKIGMPCEQCAGMFRAHKSQ